MLNDVYAGADPENVEPGGANSINYQTEPGRGGGANLFFGLTYKGERGGRAPGAPPSKSAPELDICKRLSACVKWEIEIIHGNIILETLTRLTADIHVF